MKKGKMSNKKDRDIDIHDVVENRLTMADVGIEIPVLIMVRNN